MKKGAKRILAGLLSLCMVLSTWVPAMTAEAATKLVNVALDGTASTEDGENGAYVIENVIDGNDSTSWQTPGNWPATAEIKLPGGRNISKVVVKLGEKGDNISGNTVLVTVSYAMNGVIDTKFSIGEARVTVDSDKTFELSEPSSATHVFVTLSQPQTSNGSVAGFWPSVEEIEVYEEQEAEVISSYPNIAGQAQVDTDGTVDSTGPVQNLTDKNDGTLYKFHNVALGANVEKYVSLTYETARKMDAFRIAFENVGTADEHGYTYEYSILAKNTDDTEYTTIIDHATANRTTNNAQEYQFNETEYSEVRIVMHSCRRSTGDGYGWPAIAEFEVYGNEILVEDNDNIALRKSVHASSGRNLSKNITDGSKNVAWRGTYYPAYVDIDLEKNYNLDTVEVFTPENGYSQYTIYTSVDGRNFDKLAEKISTNSATLEAGESYNANGKEARIVRVYVEYNSAEKAAIINEVRVTGTESNTPVQARPAIAVVDFAESKYANADGTALTVTADDTYEEVYGIIERQLGPEYEEWFTLELCENPKNNGYDFFELSTVNGKVHVKGNDGVSLATGINHFLKYYCNVNISQVGDQAKMPTAIPAIQGTVHKETKAKVRYSYNYCTLSYSMAFYGEKEWRDELDWLALNGVNVVLDATAQEEVWRRFLGKLGYTHEEAKDFIAGPAYYAWAYMANLSGFGGPVHDSWFEERTELARKNQLSMRKLGMQPALQGYSGMVPTDILDYAKGDYALTSSDIIGQGEWCGFTRPSMLRTTNAVFDKYAELFYQCQEEVYGDVSDYYATDPFHEGGETAGMNPGDIAEKVLNSMLTADQDGIWIIQAWQGNPTTALLNGLDRITNGAQHALVLDLYAEKDPHYNQIGSSYGDTNEFDDTPWVFCMLNNFGGRLGLHGHLDNLAEDIPAAMNSSDHIAGIGITPEASVNNPVLYDFLFETVWQDDVTKDLEVIELDSWLDDYATRRYGAESESANLAWDILKETVYKSDLNNLGQGAPESVVNARPALSINAASSWGNAVISYDKVELEKAAKLLLEDYDVLADSKGYMYDVANVLQQVLSNSAQEYHKKMVTAYNSGNAEEFEKYAEVFMDIIDYMETVTGTTEYFMLGRWVEQAKALAKNADDFTKELYELNAKALVTTWGSYNQTHGGQNLKDYSNRQWSGLIGDFYKERWELWIDARTKELNGQSYTDVDDWFPWEWNWVRSNTVYPTTATPADLKTLGLEIIEKYTSANPAADDSRDVDPTTMSVEAGTQSGSDLAKNVLDGESGTIWHSDWTEDENIYSRDKHHLTFTLNELTEIDGMRYLPRQDGVNGIITKYDLYVSSSDSGDDWELIVDDGVFANDNSWKMVSFDAVNAKRVKLQVVEAMSGENNGKMFASAATIRFTAPAEVEEEEPTLSPETEAVMEGVLANLQAVEFVDLAHLVAPTDFSGTDRLNKRTEIYLRGGYASINDVPESLIIAELQQESLKTMSLEPAFNEVKKELSKILPNVLENSEATSGSDAIVWFINKIDTNKETLLLGLTYLYRLYDFNIGNVNIKDKIISDPSYFGGTADLLQWFINLGNAGGNSLKLSNNVSVYQNYFAGEVTDAFTVTAFLEREISRNTDLTPDEWFVSTGNAVIVEEASKENPSAPVKLYSRMKADVAYTGYILPLLNVSENSIYVISNPATITFGMVDTYANPSLKESDPTAYATEVNAFREELEKTATAQVDYLDLWYRIAKADDKAELQSNRIVIDSMRIKSGNPYASATSEWSPEFGEGTSIGVAEFFAPMALYQLPAGWGVSAAAEGNGIRYYGSKALGNDGLMTYTHELTHLLVDSVWLDDHGSRQGLEGEFFPRGLYETYYTSFTDPVMSLNMILDCSEDTSRVYNKTPERFQDADDLQEYTQGMMDVLYTLDYLEAQSILKKDNATKQKWFHQMTQTNDLTTDKRWNQGNELATHKRDTLVAIDETMAAKLTTVNDLIDNNIVTARYAIGSATLGTVELNEYYTIPMFSANYAACQNDNGVSGDIMTRRQAFEFLAEYGYYEGMVPYISNQYLEDATNAGVVLSDTYIVNKIFNGKYADMTSFKKAMFERRIEKLDELKSVTINYNNPLTRSVTTQITSAEQLQELMDAALEYDLQNPISRACDTQVETLKLAVYNAYLQLTDDFTTSIYLEKEEPAPVDKTALAAAIAEADALVGKTYSADSWAALQTALAEAKTVNNNEAATAEDVANVLANLQNAQKALVENVAYQKDVDGYWTESGEVAENGGSPASNATNGTIDQNQWAIIGGNNRFESSYMQIDLGDLYDLETVNLYRYWPRTYDGTVIALYEDDTFTNPVIIHNSDKTNEHGLGAGTDDTYPESEAGMEFAVPEDTVVRYIRVYMQGSSGANNADNHVVELQAWGQKATDQDILAAEIAKAEKLSSDGYTTDSWTALQDALTAAKSVNADNTATTEDINKALTDLRAAKNALQMAVYAEKDVFVKVGETVSILDTTGSYTENGLQDLDIQKATVEVTAQKVNDNQAHLFEQGSDWNLPAIIRYNENGGTIDISKCLYSFDLVGEDIYEITGVATDYVTKKQTKVWLNTNESSNQEDSNLHGFPNSTTEEHMLVTKVMDGETVKGFSFQDQDINKTNGKKYTLQFLNNWCVFNEVAPSNYPSDAPRTTAFQLYERVVGENGQFEYKPVSEIQDGGMYLIVMDVTMVVNNESVSARFVVRPGTAANDTTGLGRNDHIAKWIAGTVESDVNEVQITGVSSGDTSVIVGTTKYNIHVLNEKDITIKTGESVRVFDQSGTFKESGRDELDPTIAEANVEAQSFTDDVTKLYQHPSYNGKTIGLSECIYTFNRNADGTYNIVAVAPTGETVYLNPFMENTQSKKGYPSRTDSERITIQKTDQGFVFLEDTKKADGEIATENYRLTFVNGWGIFNEDPVNDNGTPYTGEKTDVFTLYQVEKGEDGYTYTAVNDMSGIIDGGQYVIAANVNGTEYILRPSASAENRNDHVAQRYSEETITVAGNEVVISGISVGDTKLTVGNTVYNIHVVQNEQYVELSKKSSLNVTGTSATLESGSGYVSITKQNGENQYQIMAEELGEATVIVDKEIYHITVVEEELASGVGRSDGMVVNRLTMSANNTFELCVINSNASGEVEWLVIDKETGEVAKWANVVDGKVSAENPADQEEHNGTIVARLSDGTEVTIELKLTPAPTTTPLRLYDVYVEDLHHTDVYYGWIYEYDNPEDPDGEKMYGSTDLTQVVEGEVIYVSMGANYKNALDFFAKPEKGYALTQMRATDSEGHYKRLDSTTPEETEFVDTPTVAGYVQYHQINEKATADLVQKAIDKGCHGAQGFTKLNSGETLYTILNYRSEKLPTVTKTVVGISDADGTNYREYNEQNTKAEIGEYIYFKVTVDTYACEQLVTYSNVKLEDQLKGAEFVEKTESGYGDVINPDDVDMLDITQEIDGDQYEAGKHDYYVKYQIQAKDVASVSHSVVNTVALTFDYGSEYSNGTFGDSATDMAEILITDIPLKSIVVDFSLPLSYTFETTTQFENITDVEMDYGKVTVVSEKENADSDVYKNTITYTPTSIFGGVEAISLTVKTPGSDTEKVGDVSVIGIYPASTVYYEEGFAAFTDVKNGNGWTVDTNSKGSGVQSVQYTEASSTGNYGYDAKYAAETAGPSNGTEAVSTSAGNAADFNFTGDGLDIYANCQSAQSEQLPTGTVTVMIRNADTNAIEKLMIVNTKVAGKTDGVTNVQNSIANAYHMPIVSVALDQGKHSVKLIHTRTKEEIDASTETNMVTYPVKLDGFRVYNTLSDHSIYEAHNEANPNFVEMRNVVLNALNISGLYNGTDSDVDTESLYAEDIAKGLTQVLDKDENATAIILDNTSSTDYTLGNAQDLLDNGPKNELFLYQNQALVFKLTAGLKNVQIGLKAVAGPVVLNESGVEISLSTVADSVKKDISSSTDMFYVIGDINEETTITIKNNSANILSVTDLKYFVETTSAEVFGKITEQDMIPALSAMGYRVKEETQEPGEGTEAIERIAGVDRYATAYAVADAYKEALDVAEFDAVIVATGKNFADALSGSYLATVKKAPILLTNGKKENVDALASYISQNLAQDGKIYILGGENAVSKAVEDAVKAVVSNPQENVKRLSGANRYATNIEILKEAGVNGRELIIATGKNFADSLSASATGLPILLVKDEITDAHRAVLRQYDGAKIYIIGGENAVSEEIQTSLTGHGRIFRISGANRYETSIAIAEKFFENADAAVLASAKEFPDGLCGGPFAAAMNMPLILTAEGKTDAAAAYMQEMGIESGIVLGGGSRIADDSVREIFGLESNVEIIVK